MFFDTEINLWNCKLVLECDMWRTLKTETLINDYHVTLKKNKVELPGGAVIDDFYTVTIPDAAMIAALTTDNKIILKTEYRYACQSDIIECPAGMLNPDESEPIVAAKRELLEETGYSSGDWTYLGYTWESTSKLTNKMYLFLAKDCQKVASQQLDENEHLDVVEVPLSEAMDMVMKGEICANSSAHLILKTEKILNSF